MATANVGEAKMSVENERGWKALYLFGPVILLVFASVVIVFIFSLLIAQTMPTLSMALLRILLAPWLLLVFLAIPAGIGLLYGIAVDTKQVQSMGRDWKPSGVFWIIAILVGNFFAVSPILATYYLYKRSKVLGTPKKPFVIR